MLQLLTMIVALVVSGLPEPSTSSGGLVVQDVFGRPLGKRGLVLVDWEGYIANPAVRFFILPPPDAAYPATVVVRASEPGEPCRGHLRNSLHFLLESGRALWSDAHRSV